MADEHPWEGVASELSSWLTTEATWYADAMRGRSGRAPFAANANEAEKRDYFNDFMFQTAPDGTVLYDKPNYEGRGKLMAMYGPEKYAEIYTIVRPKDQRGRRSLAEPGPGPDEVQDAGSPVTPPDMTGLLAPGASQQVQDAGPPPEMGGS